MKKFGFVCSLCGSKDITIMGGGRIYDIEISCDNCSNTAHHSDEDFTERTL